jgi:hypothetical protein
MTLPSIHVIRQGLAKVEGALIDKPWPTTVDRGDVPYVPISQPKDHTDEARSVNPDSLLKETAEESIDEEPSKIDEPSIIFEIPPTLDDRTIRETLGRHRGSDFERLNEASGTDALAWYFPFHYRIAQHGIYISSKGALELALHCFRRKYSDDPLEDLSKKLQYASHALLRHESFHFAAECMAANWELATGTACYIKAQEKLRSSAGYIEEEEALANAYMIRGFRWVNAVTLGSQATPSLKAYCERQPRGYNRGKHYVPTSRYEAGCQKLAFAYHECMNVDWLAPRDSFDSLGLYPNASRIDWRRCPVILADEGQVFATLGIVARFIDSIMAISETDNFNVQLRRLGPDYKYKWDKTKIKLAQSTRIPSLDFKLWPPRGKGWFSVRVDRDVRAHLSNEGTNHQWRAEEIGRHDAMGH